MIDYSNANAFATNEKTQEADLLSMMDSEEYNKCGFVYRVPIGLNNGIPVIEDLRTITNVLITGIPMSGKTTFIQSLLTSLIVSHPVNDFKYAIYTSKPMEYVSFNKSPYQIIQLTNENISSHFSVLKELLKIEHESNPDAEYVVIMDDFSDLLTQFNYHDDLIELLKLSRSYKFHAFLITSMITSKVITQEIRSFVPNVISFRIGSISLSRLIGINNADKLTVPGDAQVQWNRIPYECKTLFCDPDELDSLNRKIIKERSTAFSNFLDDTKQYSQIISLNGIQEIGGVAGAETDPLYDEVLSYVVENQLASTSLIQRKFGIGNNRATRLLDLLEERGVIGPAQGSSARAVLVGDTNSFNKKTIRNNNYSIVKHHGIDVTCWIEDDLLKIETSNAQLFSQTIIKKANERIKTTFLPYSLSGASLNMPLEKIEKVTFKRSNGIKGYIHIYFLPNSISGNVKCSNGNFSLNNEKFDVLIPFKNEQETEFIEFGKEIMKRRIR